MPHATDDPVRAALCAAWSGAVPDPPGATPPPPSPPPRGPAHPLPRFPDRGPGGLLDLAAAADPRRRVGGVQLRRTPSAGGRYPVDVHLAAGPELLAYDPVAHALDGPPPDAGPGAHLLLSLTARRTVWRYGPRSLPVLLLDLGHAVAALLAAATAVGRPARATLGDAAGAPVPGGVLVTAPPPYRRTPAGHPLVDAALDVLHLPPTTIAAPPPVPPGAILARRSAGWDELAVDHPDGAAAALAAARTVGRDSVDVVEVTRTHSAPLLARLAGHSCGQTRLADAARLLLVAGPARPDESAPAALVTAGAAVHAAWLAATAAGAAARPVGCWIDAELRLAGRPRRVLHGLLIGRAPYPGDREPSGPW